MSATADRRPSASDASAPACPSCGGRQTACRGPIPQHFRFAGVILDEPTPPSDLWRCEVCQLQFRSPAPTPEELAELYTAAENEKWEYADHRRLDWALARQELAKLGPPGAVLDVGCWDGQFVASLPEGWERFGIEIHDGAAQRAAEQGVQMIGQFATHVQGYDDRFQATLAFDVAEHVHDPAALVDSMLRMTAPGGAAMIGTGNTQARSWQTMGSRYWYCTLPEHLSFLGEDWCGTYAKNRGVELAAFHRYSHAPKRSLKRSLSQLLANTTYRFTPRVYAGLRSLGLGKLEADASIRGSIPPSWTMAQDHFLAVFRKP